MILMDTKKINVLMFVINIIIVNINVKKYVMLVRKTLKKNVRKKLNIFNKNVYIL